MLSFALTPLPTRCGAPRDHDCQSHQPTPQGPPSLHLLRAHPASASDLLPRDHPDHLPLTCSLAAAQVTAFWPAPHSQFPLLHACSPAPVPQLPMCPQRKALGHSAAGAPWAPTCLQMEPRREQRTCLRWQHWWIPTQVHLAPESELLPQPEAPPPRCSQGGPAGRGVVTRLASTSRGRSRTPLCLEHPPPLLTPLASWNLSLPLR